MAEFDTATTAISHADLSQAVTSAEKAFGTASHNSALAAANIYYVWLHACSAIAKEPNSAWFKMDYKKRDDEITAHNAGLDELKKKITAAEKKQVGKLKEDLRKSNDPDTGKAIEAKIEAVRGEAGKRRQDITTQRKLSLNTRLGANEFSTVVKFVLRADSPKQGAYISRYAKVLRWLKAKCGLDAALTVEAIAEVVREAGGIEAIYDIEKNDGDGPARDDDDKKQQESSENEVSNEAITDYFGSKVADAAPMAEINAASITGLDQGGYGDVVLLVARKGANTIDIITELAVDTEELLDLCVKHHDQRLLATNPATEFVWAALAAGALVDDGTLYGGDKNAVPSLSIVGDDGGAKLVVSSRNAKMGVVVHAVPKAGVKLALPMGQYSLYHEHMQPLRQCLQNPIVRKLLVLDERRAEKDVGDDHLRTDYGWRVTQPQLLVNANACSTSMDHAWVPMSPYGDNALDIDGFKPAGTVTLSRDELLRLHTDVLDKWKGGGKTAAVDLKAKALVTLVYGKTTLTVTTTNSKHEIVCTGTTQAVTQYCRPRQLAELVAILLELRVDMVTLSPDKRGVMRVAFGTAYGTYSIYLPTADSKGKFDDARFAPINVPEHQEDVAA